MRRFARLWVLLCLPLSLAADQLRFDTQEEWQRWKLPLGAVELSEEGIIKPVRVRKDLNAVLDAKAFGGGIRGAGSNQRDAGLVMDGDRTTGWSPDPNDPVEDWWIEIDLGRVVSARQVRLIFAEEALPFEIFDLLLSTGEQARNNIGILIPGALIFRVRERFSVFNEARKKTHRTGAQAVRGADGERARITAAEIHLPGLVVCIICITQTKIGRERYRQWIAGL